MSVIYLEKEGVKEETFVELLEKTRANSLSELTKVTENISKFPPDSLESLIFEQMRLSAYRTPFEGHIMHTGAHAFPDIIANKYFGLEVKMTIADKWVSSGNSILETTRIEDVQRIYLFFAKLGGGTDIKYRRYQECMYDIGVTHSPRYKIDMELPRGESIFEKMGIDYDVLRKENNPIRRIKDYYRTQLKEGEELWWLDNKSEDTLVSPIIKPFRTLDSKEKDRLLEEVMILFPEIFGSSNLKFERAAAYLMTRYNVISSNFRDSFTAGGKKNLVINGKSLIVPKIYHTLLTHAKNLSIVLDSVDKEKIRTYWGTSENKMPRIEIWKELLRHHSNFKQKEIDVWDIFQEGLQ